MWSIGNMFVSRTSLPWFTTTEWEREKVLWRESFHCSSFPSYIHFPIDESMACLQTILSDLEKWSRNRFLHVFWEEKEWLIIPSIFTCRRRGQIRSWIYQCYVSACIWHEDWISNDMICVGNDRTNIRLCWISAFFVLLYVRVQFQNFTQTDTLCIRHISLGYFYLYSRYPNYFTLIRFLKVLALCRFHVVTINQEVLLTSDFSLNLNSGFPILTAVTTHSDRHTQFHLAFCLLFCTLLVAKEMLQNTQIKQLTDKLVCLNYFTTISHQKKSCFNSILAFNWPVKGILILLWVLFGAPETAIKQQFYDLT